MMLLLHPREATLLRYAAGSAQDTARRRVASHLADCDKCRGTVQSTRELRVALASGGAVGAPDPLLQRILQSRMQGERVILPVEAPVPMVSFAPPPRPRSDFQFPRPIVMVALGSAAAIALFSVGVDTWSARTIERAGGGNPALRAPEPQAIDRTIPRAGPFNPARLRPVSLRYGQVRYMGTNPVESRETLGIKLVRDGAAGNDWIAITEDGDPGARKPDSIWINAETLEPSKWGWKSTRYGFGFSEVYGIRKNRLEEQFRVQVPEGGSLTSARADSFAKWGSFSSLRNRDTSYAMPVGRPASLMSEAHFVAAMMAAPLAIGWQGAFAHPAVGRSKVVRFFDERTVTITGTQRVITPAGVFDCWEGTVRRNGYDRTQWYRKSDGLFVGESTGDGSPMRLRTVLLSEE